MKRDFDLIRKIMLEIEASPPERISRLKTLDGYNDSAVINAHIDLLIDAGLIKGSVLKIGSGIAAAFSIDGLTWQGHEFLASSKDGRWEKAKEVVLTQAVSVTFEALFQWLKSQVVESVLRLQ